MIYYIDSTLTIEKLHLRDLLSILSLKPSDWGEIIPAFRFYFQNDQCLCLKAVIGNKIIGTGTIIFHQNVAWLAHIMVHPDFRGQGIGKKITQTLLNIGIKRVETILLIATKLGKPVYSSLGFNVVEEYSFFNKGQLSFAVSDYIIPFNKRFKQAVFDLDTEICGELRHNFLTPLLNQTFLYVKENNLLAVYFSGFGEGLIIAKDSFAGTSMLALHLLEPKSIVMPSTNLKAVNFLISNGFERNLERYACRMVFGKPIVWRPDSMYGRFGGNLG